MPRPSQIVYSYYLPETEAAVNRVVRSYPHHVFRENISPGLDALHEPLFESYTRRFGPTWGIGGWESYEWHYYTNGSSEGLFHLLSRHAAQEPHTPLYQLKGEYQGYEAYAASLGLKFRSLDDRKPPWAYESIYKNLEPGVFFISNPSAVDGNLLDSATWKQIINNHRVVLDVAYLGATGPFTLDLSHPNIEAVVGSLSKPFGLYYHRCGLTFSRRPIDSLFGNKWFKNALSILIAREVLATIDPLTITLARRKDQAHAVAQVEESLGIRGVEPSDVWLLASSKHYGDKEFERGHKWRYCLTPFIVASDQRKAHAGSNVF